jgi:choline kinase
MMDVLDSQVRAWGPAPHAMWTLWGIIQAREDLEANETNVEFDYIGYAQCRLEAFRREAIDLGVTF